MYAAAFELFKKLAPIIAILLLLAGVYTAGYARANKHFIEYKARAEANSALVQKQLKQSAAIIGETYEKNTTINNDLTARNRQLLADRMRDSANSKTPEATSGGDETASNYWKLPEKAGRDFISEAARADEVTEIARACQQYVVSIDALLGD
jgi:hypothetical protein